jgi:selenocysteine lyase/cysteine desulfurase
MSRDDEPLRAKLGDRSLFPKLEARAYLNHAAVSPPSVAVRRAIEALLSDYERLGVGGVPLWVEQRARLKQKLAELVGAEPADLGFVSNTTRGVTDIALCLPWKRGDRVIVFEGEFPANVTPWQRAADVFELDVDMLPLADYGEGVEPGLQRLASELERGARLVAVSAVEFSTGLRMPLAKMSALCHKHGAELFVDGIQACGAVPLDVRASGIDYMSVGSHKWLMGLEGAAFVYARSSCARALRPCVAGWLSHEEATRFLFEGHGHLRYDRPIKKGADMLEGGATNSAGLASLEASLDLIRPLGPERIFEHVNRYLDALEPALVERGFTSRRAPQTERRSCILSLEPPPGVSIVTLRRELVERGVSCTMPDGLLRFSPHWPNSLDEVPFVLDAVDASVRAAR